MTRLALPYPTAKVEDLQTFKKAQLSQIDQLLTIVTLLLALSLLIALIGVVNTLLLSVYERTREIGLLRAVGETRSQLRRSVAEESVIITLLGTFLGLVIGMFFAWALIRALADQHLNVFSIPVGQLVTFVVAAAVVGVLAALYPALRASRLNVLEAIATGQADARVWPGHGHSGPMSSEEAAAGRPTPPTGGRGGGAPLARRPGVAGAVALGRRPLHGAGRLRPGRGHRREAVTRAQPRRGPDRHRPARRPDWDRGSSPSCGRPSRRCARWRWPIRTTTGPTPPSEPARSGATCGPSP